MELDINELLNFSPLMKTFTFNAWVVAGFTPITRGSKLDYYINRPQGMKVKVFINGDRKSVV